MEISSLCQRLAGFELSNLNWGLKIPTCSDVPTLISNVGLPKTGIFAKLSWIWMHVRTWTLAVSKNLYLYFQKLISSSKTL